MTTPTKTLVQLEAGLQQLGIHATETQTRQWLTYLELLQKWNKAYKMTAITDFDEMLIKHLLDSLAVAPWIKGNRIIDVGTGGGLPGIPLAILMPEKSFTLVDSIGKKIQFVRHAKQQLKLSNVEPLNIRIEQLSVEKPFDTVISRAFSAVSDFYALCHHLIDHTGQLLAMKGADIEKNQLALLPCESHIERIEVPFLEAQRHIISLTHPK